MPVEDLGLAVFVEGFQKFQKQMSMMDKAIDEIIKDWQDMVAPADKAAGGIDDAGEAAEKASKKTKKLSSSQILLKGATERIGHSMIDLARQLPRMAVEFVKLGAAVQRQTTALDSLAMSAGTSGQEITQAIRSASGFTIDRMTAMSAANKAMMLDVAKTPEQFERLTKVAVKLGRAMGVDAAKSIDDFVIAAGRQSMMIADNLGLTIKAGVANEKYAKILGKTVKELTTAEKKQAFLNEMLTAGEKKTKELGEATGSLATDIERAQAKMTDAKIALAEMSAEIVYAVIHMNDLRALTEETHDEIIKASDTFAEYRSQMAKTDVYLEKMNRGTQTYRDLLPGAIEKIEEESEALDELEFAERKQIEAHQEMISVMQEMRAGTGRQIQAFEAGREATMKQAGAVEELQLIVNRAAWSHDLLTTSMMLGADMSVELAAAMDKAALEEEELALAAEKLSIATEEYAIDSTMSWKKYFDETREGQEEFIFDLEAAEETHQAKMAELLAEGDAVKIAEEEAYFERKLESMRAMRAEEEAEQRESLGRMLLQQFEAWSALRDIPAEKAMEMRTAIALEYGLMDAESARVVGEMTGSWEAWADGFDQSAMDVMGDMDAVIDHAAALQAAIDRIPRKVPIEIAISRAGIPGIEIPEMMQYGTPDFRGGLAMLGERGPELAVLPPTTRIYDTTTTRNMVNNYNLTTQSMMRPGELQMEFMTMRMASR